MGAATGADALPRRSFWASGSPYASLEGLERADPSTSELPGAAHVAVQGQRLCAYEINQFSVSLSISTLTDCHTDTDADPDTDKSS